MKIIEKEISIEDFSLIKELGKGGFGRVWIYRGFILWKGDFGQKEGHRGIIRFEVY